MDHTVKVEASTEFQQFKEKGMLPSFQLNAWFSLYQ